jgi:ubiquinone/menaquinone biosynthesis C-methylase UbiE
MDLEELAMHWDAFGRLDPFRAILTDNPAWQQDAFFETGVREVGALVRALESDRLARRRERALDFGCGAGRLTRALARHYGEAVGVDIAPSMIELAEQLNKNKEPRCRFVLNERADLRQLEDGSFDLILTLITLQHMRPDYATGYIREFVRLLHPDGVLVMQIPTARIPKAGESRLDRRAARWLAQLVPASLRRRRRRAKNRDRLTRRPKMEMYAIPTDEVTACVESAGARVFRVSSPSMMSRWSSVQYTVVRRENRAAPNPA